MRSWLSFGSTTIKTKQPIDINVYWKYVIDDETKSLGVYGRIQQFDLTLLVL